MKNPSGVQQRSATVIDKDLMERARGEIPEDLQPCPFCGRKPHGSSRHRSDDDAKRDGGRVFIAFRACYGGGYSAHAHMFGVGATFEEADAAADAAWNTRFET
jgi:hypothetical protein